jgi:hypothetical protein
MDPSPRPTTPPGRRAVRATIILVIACVIAAAAGVLTYLAYRSLPQAFLAAGSAVGGVAGLLHQIANDSPGESTTVERDERDDGAEHRQDR